MRLQFAITLMIISIAMAVQDEFREKLKSAEFSKLIFGSNVAPDIFLSFKI